MKKHNPLVRTAPLVVLAVIASLLLQAPTYYFPLVFKNGPPPLYSTSYYIQNGDPNQTYKLGLPVGYARRNHSRHARLAGHFGFWQNVDI